MDGGIDFQGWVSLIGAIAAAIAVVISAMSNYNASKAKVASESTVTATAKQNETLATIEAQTNSLSEKAIQAARAEGALKERQSMEAKQPTVVVVPGPPAEPKPT